MIVTNKRMTSTEQTVVIDPVINPVIDPVIDIQNMDGLEYLQSVPDGSVDLILTDPPYIIS